MTLFSTDIMNKASTWIMIFVNNYGFQLVSYFNHLIILNQKLLGSFTYENVSDNSLMIAFSMFIQF